MRPDKELMEIIAASIKVSNGERPDRPCAVDIIAHGPAEAIRILELLKGKHGAKRVGVKEVE
jgi:hypothetical protein